MSNAQKPKQRLESKIFVDNKDCWLWQAGKFDSGYGQMHYEGKNQLAHRASYQMYKGPIPEGLVVMHSCDVRLCVNPNHLSVGTQKDNIQDCRDKGRKGNCGRKIEITEETASTYKQRWYLENRDRLKQEGKMGWNKS